MSLLISFGNSSPDVRNVQHVLNYLLRSAGPPLSTDGIFGPMTLSRTRDFQRQQGLQADGIIGPITARRLVGGVLSGIMAG